MNTTFKPTTTRFKLLETNPGYHFGKPLRRLGQSGVPPTPEGPAESHGPPTWQLINIEDGL